MTDEDPLLTLVHVTDTHYAAGSGMLRAFVATINSEQACPLPNCVVLSGDIIRGYNKTPEQHHTQMVEAHAILAALRCPALISCHNHDTYGEPVRGTIFDEVFAMPHLQEFEKHGFYVLLLSGALHSSDIYGTSAGGQPPPQWGFDVYTEQGQALIRARLAAHHNQHKLVFSHVCLLSTRGKSSPERPEDPEPRVTAFEYCMGPKQARPVRRVLADAGVVAHYSGHCHLNSRLSEDNVTYVTTASLCDYPGEVRYIRAFRDRIEHRMLQIPGGRALSFRWGRLRDAKHPTAELYFAGNPDEREFVIPLRRADAEGPAGEAPTGAGGYRRVSRAESSA